MNANEREWGLGTGLIAPKKWIASLIALACLHLEESAWPADHAE